MVPLQFDIIVFLYFFNLYFLAVLVQLIPLLPQTLVEVLTARPYIKLHLWVPLSRSFVEIRTANYCQEGILGLLYPHSLGVVTPSTVEVFFQREAAFHLLHQLQLVAAIHIGYQTFGKLVSVKTIGFRCSTYDLYSWLSLAYFCQFGE